MQGRGLLRCVTVSILSVSPLLAISVIASLPSSLYPMGTFMPVSPERGEGRKRAGDREGDV